MPPPFDLEAWYRTFEGRYLEELTFPEVRRALQALSSLYVERRDRIGRGAALDGRGKRAAFGLFYGPLHFLLVREIVRALGAADPAPRRIVDLGCGTGAAGAAWAFEARRRPPVTGIDSSGWAVGEASWTYRSLGLVGEARRGDLLLAPIGGAGEGVLAAFAANELDDARRATLRDRLLAAHDKGSTVLVVEAIARRPIPWWPAWAEAFRARGGREDLWRFPAALPERMKLLDKAAGLDHRDLTGRSLYLP
jgi:hypothetical protein